MLNCMATYRSRDKKPGGNTLKKSGAIDGLNCTTSCGSVAEGDQKPYVPEDADDHSNDEESEANDTMTLINTTSDSYEFDYETPFGTDTKLSFDRAMVDLLKKRIAASSSGKSFAALSSNAD